MPLFPFVSWTYNMTEEMLQCSDEDVIKHDAHEQAFELKISDLL